MTAATYDLTIDKDYQSYQDNRARRYLRKARRPSRLSPIGFRDAYCIASLVGGFVGTILVDRKTTARRVASLLELHWNGATFTRAELDQFAWYGTADLDEERRFMSRFDETLTAEDWNTLWNRWLGTDYTVTERLARQQAIEDEIELWRRYRGVK